MALGAGARLCKVLSSRIFSPHLASVRHIKRWEKPTLQELKRRNKIFEETTDSKKLLELRRRSNFIEWNRDAELYAFGNRLQEDFRLDLLDLAFTHRSYFLLQKQRMHELQVKVGNVDIHDNQHLSDIGEKAISDHVWNYMSHFFPRFPLEGIESVHHHLTSTPVLAHIAKNIGTTHIILSGDYPVEEETYAKTLKAIVGALMESQGIDKANVFVRDFVVTQFSGKDINDFLAIDDYFQVLSEILKRDGLADPEPRIICQTAVNTILANYHIGIYSNQKLVGHGSGESTDIAVQMAALDSLKRLFHTTDSARPMRYDAVLSYEGRIQKNLPLSEWSASKFQSSQR